MSRPELFSLHAKIAVITGGSGILGLAMAQGLLDAGATVIILGTNEAKIADKIGTLRADADRTRGFVCDVTDESSLSGVRDRIRDAYGRVDILINAAGGNRPGATIAPHQTIFDMNIDEFKAVSDLNFIGTVLPTLVFGAMMSEQRSGSIINISSMASSRALTRVVGYSAAKAAVDNFTRWMAVELSSKFGSGLRVNAVAPGFFLTEQNRSLLTNPDGTLTERGQSIVRMTPFGRLGEPEELVGTVVWLASEASRFVTGTVIPVDGGFSAFSGV